MATFKHAVTGVVVECDDDTATRLSGEYKPAKVAKPAKGKPADDE